MPAVLTEGLLENTRMLPASTSVGEVHQSDTSASEYVGTGASTLQNEDGQYFGMWLQFASHHVSVQVGLMHLYLVLTTKPANVSTLRVEINFVVTLATAPTIAVSKVL